MNQAITTIRIYSMLYIVIYHCVCYYGIWNSLPNQKIYESIAFWRFVCDVALHFFVFISGFLYSYNYIRRGKYRNTISFLSKKVKRLFVPYLFWGIIAWICFQRESPFILIFCGIQHLWFLLMLLGMFVLISPIMEKMLQSRHELWGGYLCQ